MSAGLSMLDGCVSPLICMDASVASLRFTLVQHNYVHIENTRAQYIHLEHYIPKPNLFATAAYPLAYLSFSLPQSSWG